MQSRALEVLVGFFICLGVAAVFILTMRVSDLDRVRVQVAAIEVRQLFAREDVAERADGQVVEVRDVGRIAVVDEAQVVGHVEPALVIEPEHVRAVVDDVVAFEDADGRPRGDEPRGEQAPAVGAA